MGCAFHLNRTTCTTVFERTLQKWQIRTVRLITPYFNPNLTFCAELNPQEIRSCEL